MVILNFSIDFNRTRKLPQSMAVKIYSIMCLRNIDVKSVLNYKQTIGGNKAKMK